MCGQCGEDLDFGIFACGDRSKAIIVDGMLMGVLVGLVVNTIKELMKKHGFNIDEWSMNKGAGESSRTSSARSGRSSSTQSNISDKTSLRSSQAESELSGKDKGQPSSARSKASTTASSLSKGKKSAEKNDIWLQVIDDSLAYGFFLAMASPLLAVFQIYCEVTV